MTTKFQIDVDLDKLPCIGLNWNHRDKTARVGGGYIKDDCCIFIIPCSTQEKAIKYLEHHRMTVKNVEWTKQPTMKMIKEAEG